MKKIALLLTLALALSSVLTAADVSVGGWFSTMGYVTTNTGDVAKLTGLDTTRLQSGAHEFEVTFNVSGENFGGGASLGNWSGRDGAWSNGWKAAPTWNNAYIYGDFVPGTFRVYGGLMMKPVMYTPWAAIEGDYFGGDAFGLGYGAYNYAAQGNRYTGGGITGLLAVFTAENFEGSIAFKNEAGKNPNTKALFDDAGNAIVDANGDAVSINTPWEGATTALELSDALENAFIFQAKYTIPETATIFAGVAPQKDAPGVWFAVSTMMVPNLLADLKLEMEMNSVEANKQTMIAANLGYDLGAVNVKSEINYRIKKDANQFVGNFQISPVVPVITLDALAGFTSTENVDELGYAMGLKLGKSFGQVGTSLLVEYVHLAKDLNLVQASYKMTMWF